MYIPLEEYNLYGEQYYNKYSKKKKNPKRRTPQIKKNVLGWLLFCCFVLLYVYKSMYMYMNV